jgi:hypothetical protein
MTSSTFEIQRSDFASFNVRTSSAPVRHLKFNVRTSYASTFEIQRSEFVCFFSPSDGCALYNGIVLGGTRDWVPFLLIRHPVAIPLPPKRRDPQIAPPSSSRHPPRRRDEPRPAFTSAFHIESPASPRACAAALRPTLNFEMPRAPNTVGPEGLQPAKAWEIHPIRRLAER